MEVTTRSTVFTVLQYFRGTISPLLNSFEFLFLLFAEISHDSDDFMVKEDVNMPAIFCRYPFLFTLDCKVAAFQIFAFTVKVPYVLKIDHTHSAEGLHINDAA